MTTIATDIQARAHTMLQAALAALALTEAKVEYTGSPLDPHPYEGASVGFDNAREETARMVFVYQDEDQEWMVDAMDADIGVPAPQPYTAARLVAYLVWALGDDDETVEVLTRASNR